MNNQILVTRPLYDLTTHYLSHWNKLLIDFAVAKHFRVIDLDGKRANRKEFMSVMKKRTPYILILNGHGNSDTLTGQNGEILVKTNLNNQILKSTIVYVLSCKTGKILGPNSIRKGTISYLGYKEDFIFITAKNKTNRPTEDEVAKLFFAPSNHLIISLIKGHTTGSSHLRSKQMFLQTIQKLITTNSQYSYVVRYLLWDMQHQVCLGDQQAKI